MTTTADYGLGGRLPLLDLKQLSGKQKELFEQIDKHVVPLADKAGFKSKDTEGHLIGPFNSTIYSPEMGGSFLTLQKVEAEYTTLSKKARQVVILSVGAVWNCAYELYAHASEADKVGLTADQIAEISSGRVANGLDDDEVAAQRFTHELVQQHTVSDETYALTRKAFNDRGVVEMLTLIGCYLSVCALLNAFSIPVPSE